MRTRRSARRLLAMVLATGMLGVLLAACGEDDDTAGTTSTSVSTTSASTTSTAAPSTSASDGPDTADPASAGVVAVYFTRDEKVAAAAAGSEGPAVARGALEALLRGPDDAAAVAGMATAIPEGTKLNDVTIEDGRATVDLSPQFVSGGGSLSIQLRTAQVVFTLTQFDTVDRVSFLIDGEVPDGLGGEGGPGTDVDRAAFANVTPLVLVSSPLPGQRVSSPMSVQGISNTFEANVLYEVTSEDGTVLDEGFTTATAGTGTWGKFAFDASFDASAGDRITLTAYQEDMESGGRRDVYEVPLVVR